MQVLPMVTSSICSGIYFIMVYPLQIQYIYEIYFETERTP